MTPETNTCPPEPDDDNTSHPHRWRPAHDLGQATAEYALVLLGAAAIALILVGWATGGGGGRIGGLLDHVVDAITGRVKQ